MTPGETGWRRLLTAAVVLSAVVGAVTGGALTWVVTRQQSPAQQSGGQPVAAGGGSASVSGIAAQRAASVVSIATAPTSIGAVSTGQGALASGFVVGADGLVATSAHAVTGATALRVATADGHVYQAVIVATATDSGIAVLRLTGAHGLTPLPIASQAPRPGDLALIVGRTPAGTEAGVGTIRSTGTAAAVGGAELTGVVRADVEVAPTDDGAPLLNGAGEVAGIAIVQGPAGTVVAAGAGALQRIVSALTATPVAPLPVQFGITSEVLDPAVAALLGVPEGALIVAVVPGGAGAAAHLSAGDVVTAVNGVAIDAGHPLDAAGLGLAPGATVTLTVAHAAGGTGEVKLTLPGA